MKPWVALIRDTKTYPLYWSIMTNKDYDWWKRVVIEQEPINPNYAWDPVTNMVGHCVLDRTVLCGYGNPYNRGQSDYKFLQYNVISSGAIQEPNGNTVHHEATHWYQFVVTSSFPSDTPCWYTEGQASLFGNALEFDPIKERNESLKRRNSFKGIVIQYQSDALNFTKDDWGKVLSNLYYPHISCTSEQDYFKYAIGEFIWEYLYDKYGMDKLHRLLLDFRDGLTFSNAIERTLGVNLISLNSALAEHLVFVFRDEN